jgi:uncharacterized membrane protein
LALVAAGIAYPALVFLGQGRVDTWVFVAVALALLAGRVTVLPPGAVRAWRGLLAGAVILLLVLAASDSGLAAKAYPVLVSAALALGFGLSLLWPPSVVERIASLSEPHLPAKGRTYCRRVTGIWTAWLVANAVLAAALALWGSVEAWALWTGLLSYLAMGTLFLGEYAVRRRVRRQWGTP